MNIQNHTVPDFLGRDTRGTVIPKVQAVLDDICRKESSTSTAASA